ncbi:hypothetical protein Trydic_g19449 [Trypoxylus dichotomus]
MLPLVCTISSLGSLDMFLKRPFHILENSYDYHESDTGIKVRTKPKGNCHNCCKTSPKDIRLKLFSKTRPEKPLLLPQVRKKTTFYKSLNNATNIVIYIHGFAEIPEMGGPNNMKNAYLSRNENYAVVIVDWSELNSFPYYNEAIANVKRVSKTLTKFLESYIEDGVIDIVKVHVIGFGLGAHVAGFIGKYLRGDLRLPRITGLDPAYKGYYDVNEDQRINAKDADFVDIIHTDGGNSGFTKPIGHLDFFPNGGTYHQPGCDYKHLRKHDRMYDITSCSHSMAYKLYIESINSPYNFPAIKCYVPAYSKYRICNKSDIAYLGFAADPKISPKDIQLKLFSKLRPVKPFLLPHVRKKLAMYRSLNYTTNVVIYIHGFMEITEFGAANNIKNAYLKRNENYAIILVDWSELVSFPYYFDATMNVKPLAKVLAKFLESYVDDGIIDIAKVHLIGFSLGAQVASFVGKYLRADLRLPRITGLDPAYPGYNTASEDQRINPEDADFVDIIHTDGGNFGFINPIGHVDFYPNGGTYYQPGCNHRHLREEERIFEVFSCSHNLAHKLYIESINIPYNFPATRCYVSSVGEERVCNKSDIVYLGFAASSKARGSYFLRTNMNPPYGKGTDGIN